MGYSNTFFLDAQHVHENRLGVQPDIYCAAHHRAAMHICSKHGPQCWTCTDSTQCMDNGGYVRTSASHALRAKFFSIEEDRPSPAQVATLMRAAADWLARQPQDRGFVLIDIAFRAGDHEGAGVAVRYFAQDGEGE